MRYVNSPLGIFALVLSATILAACGGSEQTTARSDSSAAAAVAPAPAPPAESFALAGEDSSWTTDISPSGIVFRKKKGAKQDSIVFDYKTPTVEGAISNFTSIRMAADTHRIDITLSMVPCTDKKKNTYTHKAQIWVDQVAYSGCAVKK